MVKMPKKIERDGNITVTEEDIRKNTFVVYTGKFDKLRYHSPEWRLGPEREDNPQDESNDVQELLDLAYIIYDEHFAIKKRGSYYVLYGREELKKSVPDSTDCQEVLF